MTEGAVFAFDLLAESFEVEAEAILLWSDEGVKDRQEEICRKSVRKFAFLECGDVRMLLLCGGRGRKRVASDGKKERTMSHFSSDCSPHAKMATSKVKARAAMFEKGAPGSIPRKSTPKSPAADPAPPSTADRTERFSDVHLTDPSPSAPEIPETLEAPGDPVVTPPAKEHRSLFAAISFTPPNTDTSATLHAPAPSASPNASSGGGWKSTMSHLLTRSAPSTPEDSRAPSPLALASASTPPPPQSTLSPAHSTALLLHRVDSVPTRDRRLSKDLSMFEKGREGFEKVRSEMDSAAMEMRRERESRRTETNINPEDAPAIDTPDTITETPEGEEVDWTFWGSVVQGYEHVALTHPKELSKAIQQGIPPVIRGAVWQLMSSSKSVDLEEAYKALLKLSSPHEKAIMKDLNRTFPNHKYFKEGGGVGQEGLFMVVKAYSLYVIYLVSHLAMLICVDRYDQEVGYTQGLAFIVAALLLNVRSAFSRLLAMFPTDHSSQDARRRSVLCPRPPDGLLQPALPLYSRNARSPTSLIPVRSAGRRDLTSFTYAFREKGCEEQYVCKSVVYDVVQLSASFPLLLHHSFFFSINAQTRACANSQRV